jgi:F-type H+-transporting ATPase subunit a
MGSNLSIETKKYSIRQHISESIFGFIRWIAKSNIGKRGDNYVFFIGSIFIFILVNYYAGLLPWKMGSLFEWWPQLPSEGGHAHPWHGASPCADINVTAGIAILVIITYFMSGIFLAGFKYIQMFLPINISKHGIKLNLLCLIEIMDLAIRPLTLSLRLFANTLAGETLLASFISMMALILPAAVLGFEMAVGVLQSYLFAILTAVYIGSAVQHAEHLLHDEHH